MDRRDEGGEDGEVGGGFDQAHTARDVDEHVEVPERESAAPLEHREQQREAAMIETGRHTLRRAESRLRGERLDLDQHRACAFHQCRHRGAGCAGAAAGEERRRGVRDGLQAGSRHAKHADLIHRPKPVLHRPEDPVVERRFTFEIEDGVDDMLERLRARDAAALGDVSDEHHRRSRFLGEAHEPSGALAHLADVAGRAFELFGIGGLHRVEQHDARFQLRCMMQNRLEARLAQDVNAAGVLLQAIRAQPQLIG